MLRNCTLHAPTHSTKRWKLLIACVSDAWVRVEIDVPSRTSVALTSLIRQSGCRLLLVARHDHPLLQAHPRCGQVTRRTCFRLVVLWVCVAFGHILDHVAIRDRDGPPRLRWFPSIKRRWTGSARLDEAGAVIWTSSMLDFIVVSSSSALLGLLIARCKDIVSEVIARLNKLISITSFCICLVWDLVGYFLRLQSTVQDRCPHLSDLRWQISLWIDIQHLPLNMNISLFLWITRIVIFIIVDLSSCGWLLGRWFFCLFVCKKQPLLNLFRHVIWSAFLVDCDWIVIFCLLFKLLLSFFLLFVFFNLSVPRSVHYFWIFSHWLRRMSIIFLNTSIIDKFQFWWGFLRLSSLAWNRGSTPRRRVWTESFDVPK